MSVLTIERRRRRSNNTFEAITLQLQYILEEQGLTCFVLGDDRGLLVAHAGRDNDAHVLAAYAPVVAACADKNEFFDALDGVGVHIPEVNAANVAFRTFDIDGHTMHLAIHSLGKSLNHGDVYRAVHGVRRILNENRQAA